LTAVNAMGRNIEIKARSTDFQKQFALAESLSDGPVEHFIQEDTFFNVPSGRLKLRVFDNGSGELIQYERESGTGPRECRYVRSPINDPESLKHVLAQALGIRAVVRKNRTVFFNGQTRIHLDQVEGLGSFLELEVVLAPDHEMAHGITIAHELMSKLRIAREDLISEAYVDLLTPTSAERESAASNAASTK
jgi:predicted adenylyl cyclase CyaB